MRKLGEFYQYGWNIGLHDVLYNQTALKELKSNSSEYKIYQHEENHLFILGEKCEGIKWLRANVDKVLESKGKLIELDVQSGILAMIPLKLYQSDKILKMVNIDEGLNTDFNKGYYENIDTNPNIYQKCLLSLAYDKKHGYNGYFVHGFVKNFGKPVKLLIKKVSSINGHYINVVNTSESTIGLEHRYSKGYSIW